MPGMPRLPFPEPDRSDHDAPPRRKQADAPLTVSQLSEVVRATVANIRSPLRVVGEVSNLSQRTHWFFSLKDDAAAMRCVCFASNVRRIGFPVKDGLEVVATGRLDYYTAAGNIQFYVDRLEPVGAGALELRFRALCEELRQLGYFEVERKKKLPLLPRRVAVVTSRSGAALQDVINTAHKRWPACELLLYDVRVQGEAASPQIARAIDRLSRHGAAMGIDAVILTRGGGSMEDLWAFNERQVADALYRCPLPVVAAIGHETDTTVAELVADLRCSTPTQAAMSVVPDANALRDQLGHWTHRLSQQLRRSLHENRLRLDQAAKHPMFRQPVRMLDAYRQRLVLAEQSLGRELPRRLQTATQRFNALVRQLEAVSPKRVLQRGYSYTLNAAGHVVRKAADVKPGDRLTTVLSEGQVESDVTGGKVAPPVTPPRKPRRNRKDDASAPGLFG